MITGILNGEKIGTLFLAGEKMSSRKRWIYNSIPTGRILVDEGAVKALKRNKSLLPSGVTGVEGFFKAGDVVFIIQEILGTNRRDDIARPEDIVEI